MRHPRSTSKKTRGKARKISFLALLALAFIAATLKLGLTAKQWLQDTLAHTHTHIHIASLHLVKKTPNTSASRQYWLLSGCLKPQDHLQQKKLPLHLSQSIHTDNTSSCQRWSIGPFHTLHQSRPLSQWLNQHHIHFEILTKTEKTL